jgi:hypothetical protein
MIGAAEKDSNGGARSGMPGGMSNGARRQTNKRLAGCQSENDHVDLC